MKKPLYIIKIGGKVLDDEILLQQVLDTFAGCHEAKILVHGGGSMATKMSETLGIPTQMLNGRRITDAESLKVITMVYAGFINKNIVAQLQARQCNAIGLCGADGNIIPSRKRNPVPVDFGYVGDPVQGHSPDSLLELLSAGFVPVIAPVTHDEKGKLLNTNADTIASTLAIGLSQSYDCKLLYCFEKKGVLKDVNDENSLIGYINPCEYSELKAQNIIADGMIPKLDNAFAAISAGVESVWIGKADALEQMIQQQENAATRLSA